jgi:hypothetical protein
LLGSDKDASTARGCLDNEVVSPLRPNATNYRVATIATGSQTPRQQWMSNEVHGMNEQVMLR